MSEKFPDPNKPTVERRLYSLYPLSIQKLKELAKHAEMSQSHFLRELIDVAYAERILQQKETPSFYSQTSAQAGLETKKW